MSKVPKLRFKEFRDEWARKTLGEIFSIFNGYAFSSDDSRDAGCRWVKIADVGINQINHESASYLPFDYAQKYPKFFLTEGDYVVALTRPILGGKLKIAKVDSQLNGSLLNQRVGKLVSENDLTFVYSLLQKASLIARIENRIAGTDPPNLSPNEINSLKQSLPSLPEQQKIASFLSAVDEKIQQLTRKKEWLEQYKKGVMQQLFSGKLRFKDPNGKPYPKWEEKRLGDIGKIRMCKRVFNNETSQTGDVPFYKIGTFGKEADAYITLDHYLSFKEKYPFPKVGEILISAAGTLGRTVIYDGRPAYFQDSNIVWIENDEKLVTNSFLYFVYQIVKYDSEGGTIQRLYNNIISSAKFSKPSIEEQQKIASFLTALDAKIESVATQIAHTQTFKKGLLQQMFV